MGILAPIRDLVLKDDPTFEPNRKFARDAWNVGVGIVWQLTLTALPIYIVIRQWGWAAGTLVLLVITTLILKLTWFDQLDPDTTHPSQTSS